MIFCFSIINILSARILAICYIATPKARIHAHIYLSAYSSREQLLARIHVIYYIFSRFIYTTENNRLGILPQIKVI